MLKRIPPSVSPIPKPLSFPLKQPFLLDPSCVLALMPQRDDKWFDYSGKGNHGILSGSLFKADGVSGPVMFFDGLDDNVDCGNDSSLRITTGKVSILLWLKPLIVPVPAYESILTKRESGIKRLDFGLTASTLYMTYSDDSGSDDNTLAIADYISTGTWAHLAFISNGAGSKIYIDNVERKTNVFVGAFDINAVLTLGDRIGASFFSGYLSMVKVFTRDLSVKELTRIYEAEKMR